MTVATMKQIAESHNNWFFQKGFNDFFGTVYIADSDDMGLFITGDDSFDRSQTLYTIRHFNENTGISTTLLWQLFSTSEAAQSWRKYANKVLKGMGANKLELMKVWDIVLVDGTLLIPTEIVSDFDYWFNTIM